MGSVGRGNSNCPHDNVIKKGGKAARLSPYVCIEVVLFFRVSIVSSVDV